MKRLPNLTRDGGCSVCGVGPLELCPACEDAQFKRLLDAAYRRGRRRALLSPFLSVAIALVRGLRRVIRALSGRKG